MGNHSEVEGAYYPHVEHNLAARCLMNHARMAQAAYKRHRDALESIEATLSGELIPPDIAVRYAMLSMAFAFEGYLNYAGLVDDPAWEAEWEGKGWGKKLSRLAFINGFEVDERRRPFRTIARLRLFRHQQAHPKTVRVKKRGKGEAETLFAKATVGRHISLRRYRSAYEDMRAAVAFIESKRTKSTGDVWALASVCDSTTTSSGSRKR